MFDPVRIKSGFVGLVGLRQNDNPNFDQLSSTITYNGSNVLIDHSLLNVENIDMAARNYGKFAYPDYNPATTYGLDTPQTMVRVKYSNKFYRSMAASNTGNQPDTTPAKWELVSLLSAYLEDRFASAYQDTLVEVFNRKKIAMQSKTILQTLRLYEGAGNITDGIVNDGSIVGLEIRLKYRQNIVAIIEKIGLQLTQAQDLNMRLFHSSQTDAIATIAIHHTKASSFEWHVAGTKLSYNDGVIEPGGIYYLVYDQNDLVGQAIRKTHNFDLPPCSGCGYGSMLQSFNLYTRFLGIRTIKVPAANRNVDPTKLWDIYKGTFYSPDTNYGLNLEITAKCDLTDFILQQKSVFPYALRDMITFKLLNDIANSTRQNAVQEKVASMARNELQAKYAGGMGFMEQMDKQLKAVDIEIADLDEMCMPCAKRGGLGYGTMSLSNGY